MQSNGNEQYFTEIYKKYQSYVVRVLTRGYSLPYHVVEELVQDVFINFWSAFTEGRFNKERDPKPFLATITHHRIAKYFRKNNWSEYINKKGELIRKNKPKFGSLVKVKLTEGTTDRPLEEIIIEEERETIEDMLGYLNSPPHSRGNKCLVAHLEGKTYEEIASELRISIGSVSANIFNTRKRLRKEFAKELQELYED